MELAERRGAIAYARAALADSQVRALSALGRVGAAYDCALAAARAVCNVQAFAERDDFQVFCDAGKKLGLGDEWQAQVSEQAMLHNRDARLLMVGDELPTHTDAARTVLWAERIYQAAEAHLRNVTSMRL